MKSRAILRRVRRDVVQGENLDAYIGISLSFGITLASIVSQVSVAWLINLTMLTLSILIVVSLKNRYLIEDSVRMVELDSRPDASRVLQDRTGYTPLEERLSGAEDVIVVGHHLLGFVSYNAETLRRALDDGSRITFIVSDPDRVSDVVRADIRRTVETLRAVSDQHPNEVEVRTTSRAVPCSIFATDIMKARGLIQVQPHPIFEEAGLRPHFDLHGHDNSRWYGYYRDQIAQLCSSSSPYEAGAEGSPAPGAPVADQ